MGENCLICYMKIERDPNWKYIIMVEKNSKKTKQACSFIRELRVKMLKDKHENIFMNRMDQEFTRVKTTLDYTVTCLRV